MKPKLSICMMVKNEEKNLPRCLDNLIGLMKKIPSELIIVDTGSEDNTVEIAKRYTSKVYFHKWNNNFAEMRNISIAYAKGDWIFIIDADEQLDSSKGIINFLNSKIDKSIVAGAVLVKNLNTEDELEHGYVMLISPRIFRNNGHFKYEGAVHNVPVIKGNILEIDATLIHYGYIATDKELMDRKFLRTSRLLQKELKKDPDNIYYRFQLSVSYQMHKDNLEALKEIEKAYETLIKNKLNPKEYIYLYCQLAKCYLVNNKYNKVQDVCLEGIGLEKEYIDLYFYLAQAQALLENYEEAIKNYEKYLQLVESYDNLAIKLNPAINHHTLSSYNEAYYNLSVMCYKIEDFEKSLEYSRRIYINKKVEEIYKNQNINLLIELCFRLKNFEQLKEIYEEVYLHENEEKVNSLLNIIEGHKNIISQLEEYEELLKTFCNTSNDYGTLNLIRLTYLQGKYEELYILTKRFAEKSDFNTLSDFYGDIIYYLINLHKPIKDIFSTMSENNINVYLCYLSDRYNDMPIRTLEYVGNNLLEDDYQSTRTKKILQKYILLSGGVSDEEFEDVFESYINSGIKFVRELYNKYIIDQEMINDVKNIEEVFFIYLALAKEKQDNRVEYVNYLKKALKVFPEMAKGIKLFLNDLQSQDEANGNQMDAYKLKIKSQIQHLISNNQLREAEQIIKEYEEIVTKDEDVFSLKAVILIMENRLMEANEVLKCGLEYYPNNFDLLYNLAYTYEQQGKYQEAVRIYCKAEAVSNSDEQKQDLEQSITRLRELCDDLKWWQPRKKLKVLHGTMEIANQMYTLSKGLKSLGIEVKTLNYYPSHFGYQSDYVYDIINSKDTSKAKQDIIEIAQKAVEQYDLFHFHFGTSLMPDYSDLPVLRDLDKKLYMHHWGSDVRMHSKAYKLSKYIYVKDPDENNIKRRLNFLASYIKNCIVGDYELYEYVKDYYEKVHVIPQAIDLGTYKMVEGINNKKPIIVHAPSSPEFKGTNYILQAIEELKTYYDFEFILVQNMRHEEAKEVYKKADLIIDQILAGSYGLFAVESMAMGKPVITWISEFMQDKYPRELPIISANPDNIKQKIEIVLKDKDMRTTLGLKGRRYVEEHHDMDKIAKKLLELYLSE